jgi:hypothetical protein
LLTPICGQPGLGGVAGGDLAGTTDETPSGWRSGGPRRAFSSASRCIGLRHEIVAAARGCPSVDVDRIAEAPDTGSCRAAVGADFAAARAAGIECSGTVVPPGTAVCDPGRRTGWIGGTSPRGTPVLLDDHPQAYDDVIAATLVT